MTLEQATRARKRLGRIGALICILFFGAILDTCVARFREPLFTVHLVPGGVSAAAEMSPIHMLPPNQKPDCNLSICSRTLADGVSMRIWGSSFT